MKRPKIAFVGSGGAARGIAHLGVLKACEELGLEPDLFVGASAGAIVAATYGQGVPLDVLLDGFRLPWRRRHKEKGLRLGLDTFFGPPTGPQLLDPGWLTSGLFSLDRLESMLARTLPQNRFSELPKPVLVTAVDIDRAQRVVFGPGYVDNVPVSQAVAASCCVPGLFRPYRIGEVFYVDGEVARTSSADLAVENGADIVIISSIYRPERHEADSRSLARSGPAAVLTQSLNVLLTEKERRGVELLSRQYPHVTFIDVSPDIGHIGYMNKYAARSLVVRGYRAGLRLLTEAKRSGAFEPQRRTGRNAQN
jgi:NTE family protein